MVTVCLLSITRPGEDPPEKHLLESSAIRESDETESSAVNELESGAAEANTESSAAEVNTTKDQNRQRERVLRVVNLRKNSPM